MNHNEPIVESDNDNGKSRKLPHSEYKFVDTTGNIDRLIFSSFPYHDLFGLSFYPDYKLLVSVPFVPSWFSFRSTPIFPTTFQFQRHTRTYRKGRAYMQLFLFGRTVENGRQSLGILSEITMNARKGRSLENLEKKGPSERKSKKKRVFRSWRNYSITRDKIQDTLYINARSKTFARFCSFVCRCVGWFV